MDIGGSCFGRIEPHRFVLRFVAHYGHHVVKRRDTLSGQDRLALDLIDGTFLASAGFREPFRARHRI
jgi:hypothetical protein